jgi:hypothetical protein
MYKIISEEIEGFGSMTRRVKDIKRAKRISDAWKYGGMNIKSKIIDIPTNEIINY